MPKKNEIKISEIKNVDDVSEEVELKINQVDEVEEEIEEPIAKFAKESIKDEDSDDFRPPKKKSKKVFLIVFGVLFFLMLVVWAGFFVFGSGSNFKGKSVYLEIETPAEVTSGDNISYVIKYSNGENVALKNVSLTVRYPEGFVFADSDPFVSTPSNDMWKIGDLEAGEIGQIKIYGQILGDLYTEPVITANLLFWPVNFNSEFQETQTASHKISSSVIDISVEAPDEIIGEAQTEYIIKYKNISKEASLGEIKVIAWHPADFILRSADPDTAEDNYISDRYNSIWYIDDLDPDKEDDIIVKGAFQKDSFGSKSFKIQIGIITSDNSFYIQKEKEFDIEVVKGDMQLGVAVNGQEQQATVNFGERLDYSLRYKNIGQAELGNVEVKMFLEAKVGDKKVDLFDWSNFDNPYGGIVRDNTIIWNQEKIEDFETVYPEDDGEITFSISLKDLDSLGDISGDLKVENWALVKAATMNEIENGLEIESNKVVLGFNADLNFSSNGRYFNDDNIAVGNGPVPPKVGEQTTYRIYWTINNRLHNLSDIRISSILPKDVIWMENKFVGEGSLVYDSASREIVWDIESFSTDLGTTTASFDLSILPTAQDVGKLVILLPVTNIEAVDDVTGQGIEDTAAAITSNLDDDPMVSGRGVVEGE